MTLSIYLPLMCRATSGGSEHAGTRDHSARVGTKAVVLGGDMLISALRGA